MFPIIQLDEWIYDEYRGTGKGNREKVWLKSPDKKQIAMFKLPRENRGEHWAEKLCSEISKVIGFPCADVDLAIKDGKVGSLSYFFVNESQGFAHYDCGTYFPYDYDFQKNKGYNFQLIADVLTNEDMDERDFLFVILFDALVANGDRHQDNFGITRHERSHKVSISPLYDNSASLGRELTPDKLQKFVNNKNDMLRYIYKGKSKIGWNERGQVPHFFLVQNMCKLYPIEMKILFNHLKKLTDKEIKRIIINFPIEILDDLQKEFLANFISKRRDILLKIGENIMKNNNNLILIWKNPETRQRYVVGKLAYLPDTSVYKFEYINPDLNEAISHGFKNFPNFPDLQKSYEVKDDLFNSIKTRLPLPKRPDYPEILDKYNLTPSNSPMDILEATRGRSATDTFEFVKEIDFENAASFKETFDLAGARYSDFNEVKNSLVIGDEVTLIADPENKFDSNAVKVIVKDTYRIGYVPKYYSSVFKNLIASGVPFNAKIVKLDIENELHDEWVKILVQVTFDE